MNKWTRYVSTVAIAAAIVGAAAVLSSSTAVAEGNAAQHKPKVAPKLKVDASWPKTLPNNWVIGQIGGIAVDSQDHIWVLQRPRSIAERYLGPTLTPPRSTCCYAAPSVLEFDPEGHLLQAWGGPSDPGFLQSRCTAAIGCEWPDTEHGIFVDPDGYVYIGGNGGPDRSGDQVHARRYVCHADRQGRRNWR